MKKHSKILVLLLSFMMVFTLIPTTALGATTESAELTENDVWISADGTLNWKEVEGGYDYSFIIDGYTVTSYTLVEYENGVFNVNEKIDTKIKKGELDKQDDNKYDVMFFVYDSDHNNIASRFWEYEYASEAEYLTPEELPYTLNGSRLYAEYADTFVYNVQIMNGNSVLYTDNIFDYTIDIDLNEYLYEMIQEGKIDALDEYHISIKVYEDELIAAKCEFDYEYDAAALSYDPVLEGETLWAGTESWHSPIINNIPRQAYREMEDISFITSDPDIIDLDYYDDGNGLYDYILTPGEPGNAVITITFTLYGKEYTVSGEYTVKEFPVLLSSLTIDGEPQDPDDYNYHNYLDFNNYEGTSPSVKFTIAEGWTLDYAYGNMESAESDIDNLSIDKSDLGAGWTFDFPEDYVSLRAFFEFVNDEGDSINLGIRFNRDEGYDPYDPGEDYPELPGDVFWVDEDGMLNWTPVEGADYLVFYINGYGNEILEEENGNYDVNGNIDRYIKNGTIEKPEDNIYELYIYAYDENSDIIGQKGKEYTYETEAEYIPPEHLTFTISNGRIDAGYEGADGYQVIVFDPDDTYDRTVTWFRDAEDGVLDFDLEEMITAIVHNGDIEEADSYHIMVKATIDDVVVAEGETDYSFIVPAMGELNFSFDKATGLLSWDAVEKAVDYSYTIGEETYYLGNETSLNVYEEVDRSIASGRLEPSDEYSVYITAETENAAVLAEGTFTFEYDSSAQPPAGDKILDTIELTNINTEIMPGEKAEFTANLQSENMTIENERWFRTDQGKILTGWSEDLPEVGEEYIYFITINADEGYSFANAITVKYNGEEVDADIDVISETKLNISGIIPNVTVTEQEITAVYERVTPFEVIMERDFRDYGDGLQYCGETINCPDAGDKVTFTFPDGTVKHFEYQAGSSYYTGKFVNTEDATETIPWNQTHINILAQAYDWEPGGDKNYYEVEFLNYPEDGDLFSCRVPVEVSSTPVASVEYEPVPVLLWANDAGRSGMPAGSKVTVTYKDGTSEVFVDDYETHSWISQETNEPIPANDNIYYKVWIERDREELSCTASYMGVTSEKNYGALYVAQSISLHQEEPMVLKKGKNSTTMTDAAGNEYENYELYRYNWFGENDVLTIKYKNGLGEYIDVDYVTDSETSFGLAEDSPYYSGYKGDDHLSDSYITIHMPDQSEKHFEIGQTYSMNMTYHPTSSNYEYPVFTTEGEPYKVLIKEAGPEDVTSVSFTSGSSIAKVKKGETLQLAVSWEPSYANVPADAITWVSTNPSVATIDGNGLVTAVSVGSTQITAQIGDRIAYKNVEVYEEKVLTDETVSLSQTVFPYTGNLVSVDGCVLYNGEPVPRTYCSFNYTAIGAEGQPPREIGDYKVVITGSYGGYSGSATEYFTIKGDLTRNATNLNVTLDAEEYTYSGTPVEPKVVSVTARGKGGGTATLVEGQDYTVSYMNNTAAGTGFVIISAIEDSYYRGEKMIPFTIKEAAPKNGWVKDDNGDWYYYDKGVMVTSKWMKDSKGWCYLGPDGKMVTNGWAKDSKGYCWIGPSGYMVTDTKWIDVDGTWYYIKSGYMAVNQWQKDGKGWMYLGPDGLPVKSVWKKDSKGWCYLGDDGYMVTNDWAKDSKGYCWIAADGYMPVKTQWIQKDGKWYHITNGYRDENKWMKDSKGWCWLQEDGSMLTNGWAKDSKGWCWIASNGYMPTTTQWVKYEGQWYHITKGYRDENKWVKDSQGWCWLQADGSMLTNGWAKDSKGWCWIASNGYMPEITDWIDFEGERYYIEKGYRAESKWLELDGHRFYLKEDGCMAHDEVVTIDGIQYLFDENGYLVGAGG